MKSASPFGTIYYRDAVAKADSEFDAKLPQIQERFDEALARGDVEDCNDCNRRLHSEIEGLCNNREAVRAGRRYVRLTGSLRDLFGFDRERLEGISRDHWDIIKAIASRNPEAAT